MAEVSWIKITTDIFDDEKFAFIETLPEADSIIVIWFKLLALAGKSNNSGIFMISNKIPYTEELFATVFRRPLNTIRLALSTFENLKMIEICNGIVTLPNWEKHQNIDGLQKIREKTRERVARYRANQKAIIEENDVNSENVTECNVTVTQQNKNKNKNKNLNSLSEFQQNYDSDISDTLSIPYQNLNKESEEKTKTKKFVKPSVDEIKQYCQERNNKVDAEKFFDYYESKGWIVGKSPMKDWKACVRTWERNNFDTKNGNKGSLIMQSGIDNVTDEQLRNMPF